MSRRRAQLLGVVFLVGVVAASAALRVDRALTQPNFDSVRSEKMLKSDPGLLMYITQRIIDAGGLPPDDFRADVRIEYPEPTDIPAMFTVGEEFLVAWSHWVLGGDTPLHVFATILMAVVASLTAVGVYGLAFELAGSLRSAVFAASLFAILPANYRTIGAILMREDLSLPLFALHLWLTARAARVKSVMAFALAGLALLGALATWHAMTFIVTIEALCVFAWFLRTGDNPLRARPSWIFPLILFVGSLLVPVLRAKGFVLSIPMWVAGALWVSAIVEDQSEAARDELKWVGVAGFTGFLALSQLLSVGADYAHVFELLVAKVRYLGVMPADPSLLPFGAKLLWQGPFSTGSPQRLFTMLGLPGVLLLVPVALALPGWWRGRGDAQQLVFFGFAGASIVAALLVSRMVVLCGILLPVALALLFARMRPARAIAAMLALVAIQGLSFARDMQSFTIHAWYPIEHQADLERVIDWIRANPPRDGAVAGDFVSATGILAHTGLPVSLQPKYETRRSRDRIEAFLRAFYWDSPAAFRAMLRQRFEARYLVVDVGMLWSWRYQAGVPWNVPGPPRVGAATSFLNPDPAVYQDIPGFRLVYATPQTPPRWRIYEIE